MEECGGSARGSLRETCNLSEHLLNAKDFGSERYDMLVNSVRTEPGTASPTVENCFS